MENSREDLPLALIGLQAWLLELSATVPLENSDLREKIGIIQTMICGQWRKGLQLLTADDNFIGWSRKLMCVRWSTC